MGGGGSSKYNGASMIVGGMLSTDPTINPYFYNYSMVFIHYCDGTSHSSNATAPVPVSAEIRQELEKQAHANPKEYQTLTAPSQIYFRGRANLIAVIEYLKLNTTLGTATDVILSGGSAGATSTYLALDFVPSLFSSNVRLVGAPDAGFFLDAYNVAQNSMWYRTCFQAADPLWNSTGSNSLNSNCLKMYSNETWKCFLQQYNAINIETPYIILNSAYDMWQILNDLQLGCVPSMNGQPVAGIQPCNTTQMETYQNYRTSQLQAVAPALSVPSTGAFIDSCFVHETNVDYCSSQSLPNCIGWNIYNVSIPNPIVQTSVNMDETFYTWYNSVVSNNQYPIIKEQRKQLIQSYMKLVQSTGRDINDIGYEMYFKRQQEKNGHQSTIDNLPTTIYEPMVEGGSVQVIDSAVYPANPSCPFPTPHPAPK